MRCKKQASNFLRLKMIKFLFLLFSCSLFADEIPLKEVEVEAFSQIDLGGAILKYQVVSGTLILKDEAGKDKAEVGYTAYFLKDTGKDRPIAFGFNGGPGAASIWLNSGWLGPKRIAGNDLSFQDPPFSLVDNEASLIDQMDLVFVDPVSTGFSRPAKEVSLTDVHGVDEDVKAMSEFVRLFTGKFKRFDSPKYFIGESYGGIRAVKVAYKLHDDHGYYLNGLILVSPALDLQTISFVGCNDLPYILFLPSMAAAARYHNKAAGNLDLKEVEAFARGPYASALFKGSHLTEAEKTAIAETLSRYTGLRVSLVKKLDLRIPSYRFIKDLLEDEGKIIGRFDGRVTGIDAKESETYANYDPSVDAIIGAVTATFSQYLLKELKWPDLKDYRVLTPINPWNWGKGNQFASCLSELNSLMAQNPALKVVVLNGLYDLAVPYGSLDFALSHAGIDSKEMTRISRFTYPAGHMMYFDRNIRKTMKEDLLKLFEK